MSDVLLFVEDAAQENFLGAMLTRLARESGLSLSLRIRSARGGSARVLAELESFVRDAGRGKAPLPAGIVVAVDANCQGYNARRKAALEMAGAYKELVIFAIPDPHIERWFLLDGEAFKAVLGQGCKAPALKCEKGLYKSLLSQAVLATGVQPLLGGIEYAEDIVNEYHVQRVADAEPSFGKFVAEFRAWVNQQRRQRS
jgi:hypothetical protein